MTDSQDHSDVSNVFSRRSFLAAAAAGAGTLALTYGCASLGKGTPAVSGRKNADETPLAEGWTLQSSDVAKGTGELFSSTNADTKGWYAATVPSTVLAVLVANGEYPDLFVGENLKQVPVARFKNSWWYRKEFAAASVDPATQTWLYFKGINYRANIWLNSQKIADAKEAVGTYRDLELLITPYLRHDGPNVLAIEVFPPGKGDLTITFVDWAPKAPDANMGLWQDVVLRTAAPAGIRYPHVVTDLDVENLKTAKLTVMADLVNPTEKQLTGTLAAVVGEIVVEKAVTLEPRSTQTVTMTPEEYAQLVMAAPRVWWPHQLGKPEMYTLGLTLTVDGKVSDKAELPFGVRKVTSRLLPGTADDSKESLLFTVNGVDLLITGGGYAPDLLQRRAPAYRPSWQEDHIRYVRDMHLNTVRLEGKLEDDAFYDLCDQYGVLVMAGWCCCSPWEQWKNWKEEQTTVAMESMKYQIRRARAHPSLLCFLNGSDNHPTPAIEKQYLDIEKELHWPNPTISSATAKKAASGPSGVKMEGPYKYETPIYWLTDKTKGGAHGFNTEVGPGPCPPPIESLNAMLPLKNRWPIDGVWGYHCGQGTFSTMKDFTDPLDARFGKSTGIADFSWKAQAQAYETIRAMYEGFRRNKFNSGGTATGEIQWMLNNAWPSMIWHLYDYYFRPGGPFFATKIACEPVHILFSYDNRSIVVANDTLSEHLQLSATADIYDLNAQLKHHQSVTLDAPANKSVAAFTLPEIPGISTTYFLRLTLKDAVGQAVSTNTYFLSTKPDVLDPKDDEKDDWFITKSISFADFTELQTLPAVTLEVGPLTVGPSGGGAMEGRVSVKNSSAAIALMVRLKLNKSDGQEVLPINWEDNYFTLLPGESRAVTARYLASDQGSAMPVAVAECFNNNRT